MSDIQDSILCLNFTQMLPKTILDKISSQENNEDRKPKIAEGKIPVKMDKEVTMINKTLFLIMIKTYTLPPER